MPNLTSVRATEFNFSIQSYQLEGSRKGYYGSLDFFSLHNITSCSVHSSVVEVEMSCVKPGAQLRRSCRSARIRNAPGQESFSNATVFSRGEAPGYPLGSYPPILLHDLVRFDLATHNSEFNAFQKYLSDPTAGFANTASDGDDFCNVPAATFEARLGLLINTFWVPSLEQFTVLNRDGIKGPEDVNWTTSFYDTRAFLYANSTSVSVYATESTYRILVPWMSTYLATVAVLTLVTICNLCFVRRIWAHKISFLVPHPRDAAHPGSGPAQDWLRISSGLLTHFRQDKISHGPLQLIPAQEDERKRKFRVPTFVADNAMAFPVRRGRACFARHVADPILPPCLSSNVQSVFKP